MYSSSPVYRTLANELHRKLRGLILSSCFSNTKEELIMHFEGERKLQLSIRFAGGEMFYFCDEISIFPGRNAMYQFRHLEQKVLEFVNELPDERAFYMLFDHAGTLHFKGYGKFGNILHYETENKPVSIFRRELKADLEKTKDSFFKETAHPHYPFHTEKELKKHFPWFTAEITIKLDKDGFYLKNENLQSTYIYDLLNELSKSNYGMDCSLDPPALLLCNQEKENEIASGMDGLMFFAKQYLQRYYFIEEKAKRLQQARQTQKHLRKLQKEQTNRTQELTVRRSYKELGDIVLTYAHTIKPGVMNAFLTDYYTGNQIRIKLDPNLNAAENAEKYYRKAKNEVLEKKKLAEDLEKTSTALLKTEDTIAILESANDFKGLKGKAAEVKTVAKQEAYLPYKTYELDGYEIWVGKNAKGNDAMLKLAGKNDLWLHARGYAGSHVIVRKKGAEYPDTIIAYAARLAAENSKAKTQKIVPVYCVERKFITKPKKAMVGEVVVMKELVVDAILE